ncbi:unnamed protein product [Prorocentrum cordatum]|uniref:Uncharacterized protein n=1 Tax=Prorocentrum cordatum TaxID=2364126 RepID=A0ABN9QK41_9DINO|nr:unnamed protein product [Polarella glacialis]
MTKAPAGLCLALLSACALAVEENGCDADAHGQCSDEFAALQSRARARQSAFMQEPTDVPACRALTAGDQCPSSVEGINTALTCQYNAACTVPGGPVGCFGATGCQYYDVDPCKALGSYPAACPAAVEGINTALHCVYNEKCISPGGPVGCWGSTGCQYYTPPTPALMQEPTDVPACRALTAGDQCPSSVEGINTALTCQYNAACTVPGGPVGCFGATGCQYYDVDPCKALGSYPAACPAAVEGINTALHCVYNEKCISPGGPVGCWGSTGCQYYTPPTPALMQEPWVRILPRAPPPWRASTQRCTASTTRSASRLAALWAVGVVLVASTTHLHLDSVRVLVVISGGLLLSRVTSFLLAMSTKAKMLCLEPCVFLPARPFLHIANCTPAFYIILHALTREMGPLIATPMPSRIWRTCRSAKRGHSFDILYVYLFGTHCRAKTCS